MPQLNIFAEPDADALAAVLGRGFGAAEWGTVAFGAGLVALSVVAG